MPNTVNGTSDIIWDWNGTLLDDVHTCVASLNAVLSRRGLPTVTCQKYREIFCFPVKDYYKKIGLDFTVEDWDLLAAEYNDTYANKSRNTPLREGTVDTLTQMHEHGIRMSVLSAANLALLEDMLEERNIRHFFAHIYGLSNLYAESKLELSRMLRDALNNTNGNMILIGDTTHDYDVALELKCKCVLITGGHQTTERLRQCNCAIVSSMSEIMETSLALLS